MVLDRQGGPNWFKNWCVAPIIVDPEQGEVYLTPLYYVMSHFSKFIRPGARVIQVHKTDDDLMVSATENLNGSIVVVVFNEGLSEKYFNLNLSGETHALSVSPQALQTIIFTN
jgi:glucosylceramidase